MPRRVMEGRVVSDKQDKTVTVLVERRVQHPVYKKFVKKAKKYAAHDESNAFRAGDWVAIEECRPLSKRKSWKVISAPAADAPAPAPATKETKEKPAAKKAAPKKTTKKKATAKSKA